MKEMKKEIKVKVTYIPGYEKRFTNACLEVIRKRKQYSAEPEQRAI